MTFVRVVVKNPTCGGVGFSNYGNKKNLQPLQ